MTDFAPRDFATVDFYTDLSLMDDPHAYFDYLRQQGPVVRLPLRNVVAVTGFEEAVAVSQDSKHFSAVNGVTGPLTELPFAVTSDDITEQLAANRAKLPFSDQVVTQDGERHAHLRSILAPLFKPSRLRALEEQLRGTADALIDEFIASGRVNLVKQYGGPYATHVISDLLGIPPKGRAAFREILKDSVPVEIGATPEKMLENPLVKVGKALFGYLAVRRAKNLPGVRHLRKLLSGGQDDILTELALARFPDGSKPSLVDITGLAAFLFGAGQDTTNRLLASCMKVIAERADIQAELRANPEKIPDFIEELLRFDGAVKSGGRLCVRTTTIAGVEIKAGTTIMLTHLGANRDPARYPAPGDFIMNRPRIKEHFAFGRGPHACIGAALARAEVRISIERLLARMANIRLAEAEHGPAGARRFEYEPTYVLRALKALHLEFEGG